MRPLVLAVVLAAAVPLPLSAQPGRPLPIPRAVAEDIASRARADGEDGERADAAQVLRFTESRERDLNGDGRPELFITGTGPLCGANNCSLWVYGRENGGRFRLLLATGGVRLDPERGAARGFRDLRAVAHMSAAQSYHTVYRHDGRAYEEVATEIHGREGLLARVTSPLAAPGQPRRVTLQALPPEPGSALRLSAAYTGCAPGRATRGRLCGDLRLGLAGPAAGGALPAPGPGCFTLEVAPLDDSPRHSSRVACEAAPVPARGPGRSLALRLAPEAWEAVAKAYEVRLVSSPGSELRIGDLAKQGLAAFVGRVYELNGVELYPQDR